MSCGMELVRCKSLLKPPMSSCPYVGLREWTNPLSLLASFADVRLLISAKALAMVAARLRLWSSV